MLTPLDHYGGLIHKQHNTFDSHPKRKENHDAKEKCTQLFSYIFMHTLSL